MLLKKVIKTKRVFLGETTSGKLIILLLYAWVQVQANSFPHHFLCEKGFGILTTTGLGENPGCHQSLKWEE
jgi:hypothetical protein